VIGNTEIGFQAARDAFEAAVRTLFAVGDAVLVIEPREPGDSRYADVDVPGFIAFETTVRWPVRGWASRDGATVLAPRLYDFALLLDALAPTGDAEGLTRRILWSLGATYELLIEPVPEHLAETARVRPPDLQRSEAGATLELFLHDHGEDPPVITRWILRTTGLGPRPVDIWQLWPVPVEDDDG
jgi:hypothetical protein